MKKNSVHGTPEQFQHEVERKIAELANSSIDSSTDVNSSTNKTILSRLSKSGYTIKEVRKMFEDQTGLEMTSDHSREFNEWAEDFLRLIERSTDVEACSNITASSDVSLDDIDTASTMIKDKVSEDANIIWGAVIDEKMDDEMSVTVIATGFNADGNPKKNVKTADTASIDSVIADDKKDAVPTSTKDKTEEDDDTFYDIMSIFNK